MAQTTITNYFTKRKRTAEEIKNRRKVFVLDRQVSDSDSLAANSDMQVVFQKNPSEKIVGGHKSCEGRILNESVPKGVSKKLIYEGCEKQVKTTEKCVSQKAPQKKNKMVNKVKAAAQLQCDIRDILLKCKNTESPMGAESSSSKEIPHSPTEHRVVFELKGSLSPKKKIRTSGYISTENGKSRPTEKKVVQEENTATYDSDSKNESSGFVTPTKICTPTKVTSKNLSYNEIKGKLSRSEKLAELRKSLSRFKEGEEKLKKIQQKRKELDKPGLKKFQAIEIEVPVSPQKNIYNSPQKVGISPQTTPTKSPAYQRFASLAVPASVGLPLPYSYFHLGKIFHCVDIVVSMLHNRKELIRFQKLKPSVEEMSRRNFTEHHLGQIKSIYPNAFIFHQEKCRNFGSTSKADQYDLILTPLAFTRPDGDVMATEKNNANDMQMTPSCLLERRQKFHENLLEKVKDYHEEFLQTLTPPLIIPREKLKRWHPGFEVDQVPDIEPESLPQPPNMEKYSSAKDVLERAKNILNCNRRMEKALQMVSISADKQGTSVTAVIPSPVKKTPTSPISELLKGVPKCLLEKIRAKQAAKALEAMTRSPAQDHEAIQHMRLPDLARILRNLFIAEKKSILTMDFTLEKLRNSYREKLPRAELEEHIHLLIKEFPTWLTIVNTKETEYLRLSKSTDMAQVMKRLETLAKEKNGR